MKLTDASHREYKKVCDVCLCEFLTEDKDESRCFYCRDDGWFADPDEGDR